VGGALAIGVAAGVICFWAATALKRMLGYDDSLDAFGVHCIGGIIGAVLTGVFAVKEIGGADGNIVLQLKGVATTLVYSGIASFILLKLIDMTMGLRVSSDEEREGLDLVLHGEQVADMLSGTRLFTQEPGPEAPVVRLQQEHLK
jgi:Amt family ammonium transporter